VFEVRCADKTTLAPLIKMASDRALWPAAHDLFSQIRTKTLKAERSADRRLLAQYALEEVCAKTFFNLTSPAAPFDADSAFWILPLAIGLARELGISDLAEVSSLLKL